MTFVVVWLSEAEGDLERHFQVLNDQEPRVASRAVRAILAAGASLAVFPHRGRLMEGTQQRKLRVAFGKYSYVLYYRVEGDRVLIVRVHHGRENLP